MRILFYGAKKYDQEFFEKLLPEYPELSITYIAGLIGYDDPNRFSQVFSKMVGMPPSEYRNLSVRLP